MDTIHLRPIRLLRFLFSALSLLLVTDYGFASGTNTLRIAAAQPKRRVIDWHIREPATVLARVDQALDELEALLATAAAQGCAAVALPEDTLRLGAWEAGNPESAPALVRQAVQRMLSRFETFAAQHRMYVICCTHCLEPDGATYNTAFLLGKDGKEIGRYHKVCPTMHEGGCKPGRDLPVFHTPDLGDIGLLICYDLVFPETTRALALNGADIIFDSTLGGAAIGDDDISRAAFRTRAVENFVYLVVAQRSNGSMIISPQGKIIAEAKGPDSLAVADIDPFGGREGGDAFNRQKDMRARLFRERNPVAFGILTETNPPVLRKVPLKMNREEMTRLAERAATLGEEEFRAAGELVSQGKPDEAIKAFRRLQREYPDSWIDIEAARRLADLQPAVRP